LPISRRSSTDSSGAFVSCSERRVPRARGTARRLRRIPPFVAAPFRCRGSRRRQRKAHLGAVALRCVRHAGERAWSTATGQRAAPPDCRAHQDTRAQRVPRRCPLPPGRPWPFPFPPLALHGNGTPPRDLPLPPTLAREARTTSPDAPKFKLPNNCLPVRPSAPRGEHRAGVRAPRHDHAPPARR